MEPELKFFGHKLHALRVFHNLSLQQLASMLGYTSHGYLSELEAGKKLPTVLFVLKLARLFDLSLDELLKDEIDLDLKERQ